MINRILAVGVLALFLVSCSTSKPTEIIVPHEVKVLVPTKCVDKNMIPIKPLIRYSSSDTEYQVLIKMVEEIEALKKYSERLEILVNTCIMEVSG